MSESAALVLQLSARLPELERQLFKLGSRFQASHLPKGLFGDARLPEQCLVTITADLERLFYAKGSAATYLATRIAQKIRVLVHLCQHNKQQVPLTKPVLHAISTRRQWLDHLAAQKTKLLTQQQALQSRLDGLAADDDVIVSLFLQQELRAIAQELRSLSEQ